MTTSDDRPAVWVGHVALGVSDPRESSRYLKALGMRGLQESEGIAILELRGGTHLLLRRSDAPIEKGTKAPFDLMVDDVDAAWKEYEQAGLSPSEIGEASFHRYFTLTEPGGHEITVNSTHVAGVV